MSRDLAKVFHELRKNVALLEIFDFRELIKSTLLWFGEIGSKGFAGLKFNKNSFKVLSVRVTK